MAIWRGDSDFVDKPSRSEIGASGAPAASGISGVTRSVMRVHLQGCERTGAGGWTGDQSRRILGSRKAYERSASRLNRITAITTMTIHGISSGKSPLL